MEFLFYSQFRFAVSPACDMPRTTARTQGKLVICNLQTTPLEDDCYLHLYARCDIVMKGLMERLGLIIPPFTLNRTISMAISHKKRFFFLFF